MNNSEIKILIADDHSILRSGIIKSLSAKFPYAEFGEAANTAEVQRILNTQFWDLLILDISMPGRSGLDILSEVKAAYPKTHVIIFSMYPEDQFAIRAIKAGASAYLSKDISSNDLVSAIIQILDGHKVFSPSIANLLIEELQGGNKNKVVHELLSEREFQVFRMISGGKSVSEIAVEINLSVKTISTYRANILKKMNLKNNSEIMYYAFKNNLRD